jgi:hypothetical protein
MRLPAPRRLAAGTAHRKSSDRVADEFVDRSVIFLDDRRHLAEVVVQQGVDGLGRKRVGERGKAAQIRHHDRDGLLLAAEIQIFHGLEEVVGDLARQVAAEGLLDEPVADLELLRPRPHLVLEVLDDFGVLDRHGDLTRQELQKLRAFGRERRARQIVLEIHEADQLALVQNRLAEDGPRLLLLHVRVRHEPSILLRVVDNDDLFRPRGEMNDAEGCEAGAVR